MPLECPWSKEHASAAEVGGAKPFPFRFSLRHDPFKAALDTEFGSIIRQAHAARTQGASSPEIRGGSSGLSSPRFTDLPAAH